MVFMMIWWAASPVFGQNNGSKNTAALDTIPTPVKSSKDSLSVTVIPVKGSGDTITTRTEVVAGQNRVQTGEKRTSKGDSMPPIRMPHKGLKAANIGYEIIEGDTIPIYYLDNIYIHSLKSEEEVKRYKKLVRDVKIALPYAKLAAFRLQMMEDNLRMIKDKKERKKYVKQCEKAIKEEFMNDLKNLTVTQGRILLKLIHRETGKTTWEILNSYQGKLAPIFWNTMANMYGATTKETFDPILDKEIDDIIRKMDIEH
jgi:hypothetical protein